MNTLRNRRLLGVVAALMLSGGAYQAGRATASAGASGPVEAAFAARSYSPGSGALLHLRGYAAALRVQFYRAGGGHVRPLEGLAGRAASASPKARGPVRPRLRHRPRRLSQAQAVT